MTDAAAKRMKLSTKLIVSEEYDRVCNFMAETKQWVVARSVPSFFRDGCFLLRVSMVEEVNTYLVNQSALLEAVVDALAYYYPQRQEEARVILEPDGMYDPNDYPSVDELKRSFYWDYMWVTFSVPKGIPEEIRQAEIIKAQNMWEESANCITMALRESFKALITHAVDKLQVGPDGKPKVFRDTMLPNIKEFLETFHNRNVTNDEELAALVEKAQYIVGGVEESQVLRDNMGMRRLVKHTFEQIQGELDSMVVNKPRRKFALSDEEE
jgi:hypothetical protein